MMKKSLFKLAAKKKVAKPARSKKKPAKKRSGVSSGDQ